MAGGWGHIVNEDGSFAGGALLENGGDVEEAVKELYGMVWWLAARYSGVLSSTRSNVPVDPPALIEAARRNHKLGMAMSPKGSDT